MNFLKEYFIGDYLRSEPDVLKQASVKLIFNVILIANFSLVIIFCVYLVNGFYYQLVKSLVVITLFTGVLFYIKSRKSIGMAGHLMLLISWSNILINLFFLFQDFNAYSALITTINILFA